ncbi:hypothetical protein ACOI1C_02480 [Bacillus sp. DJP31]|uniref:hypothetical protein n=1 Tax=Bacillus sp. DJP31 TaxID=3409789 RepID=UPI003BB81682
MRNSVLVAALVFLVYSIFRKRYRVLNSILGNPLVRRLAVQFAMQLPFIRERFLKQAFR